MKEFNENNCKISVCIYAFNASCGIRCGICVWIGCVLVLPVRSNTAKEIISVIFIGVNFAMLYIPAKNFGIRDNKSYALKPNK